MEPLIQNGQHKERGDRPIEKILFGTYLVEQGLIKPAELEAVLLIQEERNPRIGALALRRSLLSFEKICEIHTYQRRHHCRFGEAAVALGFLTDVEVAELLEEQASNHIRIGELLVQLNLLHGQSLPWCLKRYFESIGDLERAAAIELDA